MSEPADTTAAPPADSTADDGAAPPRRARTFRKSRPPMVQANAARQARIAALAWSALGNRERVMAFLNADHAELGGRPLDLAIASDDGLARVEGVLHAMAAARAAEG